MVFSSVDAVFDCFQLIINSRRTALLSAVAEEGIYQLIQNVAAVVAYSVFIVGFWCPHEQMETG